MDDVVVCRSLRVECSGDLGRSWLVFSRALSHYPASPVLYLPNHHRSDLQSIRGSANFPTNHVAENLPTSCFLTNEETLSSHVF